MVKNNNVKNDLVKKLKTKIQKNKLTISLRNNQGMGYDGCGTHTHGWASSDKVK